HVDRAALVDRLAEEVEHAAQRFLADGHRDGRAGVDTVEPAAQSVGRAQRHGADLAAAEVRGDFAGEPHAAAARLLGAAVAVAARARARAGQAAAARATTAARPRGGAPAHGRDVT